MLIDPNGAMGLPPEMLHHLSLDVAGSGPGAHRLQRSPADRERLAELRGRWPSRFGHLLTGTVLLASPVTETLLLGYPVQGEPLWLRPAVAIIGLALMILGLRLRHLTHTPRRDAISPAATSWWPTWEDIHRNCREKALSPDFRAHPGYHHRGRTGGRAPWLARSKPPAPAGTATTCSTTSVGVAPP